MSKKIMGRLFFLSFLLSFLAGIFIYNILQEGLLCVLLFLFFFLFLLQVAFWKGLKNTPSFLACMFGGYIVAIIFASFFYHQISLNLNTLIPYTFGKQDVVLQVQEVYARGEFSTQYKAKLLSINGQNIDKKIYTLSTIPNNFSLEKGTIFQSITQLNIVEDFDSFHYQKFLLSKNIYTKNYVSVVSVRETTENIFTYIESWRQSALQVLGKLYPPEERIFLAGILFGAREDIPKELETHFNNSGLTHLIAVSGFNISILIVFLGFFVGRLPHFLRLFTIVAGISFFVIFVGFGAPVVRAGIMGILGYMSLHYGRNPNTIALVIVTAFLMLLYSPLSLNYDVSFQLSFLAVLGIYYTQAFFKKVFFFVPQVFAIQEALVLTLSALILTVPIMLFQFGQISLLAPLANIAVTWTIPLAMLGGFISFLSYLVFPTLGYIVSFFTWILLKYDIFMVHLFGSFEPGVWRIDFGEYGVYLQSLYFLILLFLIVKFSIKKTA